jgi:quercetin 2,3-dioxygenase
MITVRRAADRGHFDHGWLDTFHTFSFAGYRDPGFVGFRALRVLNEDRVAPGQGFGEHPHRDMEIVSWVLSGALAHRDSLGNGSTLRRGDLQRMTAGTGVVHAEFNASASEPVHFLQIWILPERTGLAPGYEQRTFSDGERRGRLRLVASRDGAEGSITVHQDLRILSTLLSPGEEVRHPLAPGRHAWLQVASGEVEALGERLSAGDGAAISSSSEVVIRGVRDAEALLLDLA